MLIFKRRNYFEFTKCLHSNQERKESKSEYNFILLYFTTPNLLYNQEVCLTNGYGYLYKTIKHF